MVANYEKTNFNDLKTLSGFLESYIHGAKSITGGSTFLYVLFYFANQHKK